MTNTTTEYLVPSFSDFRHYSVTYDSHLMCYECSCPDFQFHCEPLGEMCKHISKMEEFSTLKNIPTTKSDYNVSVVSVISQLEKAVAKKAVEQKAAEKRTAGEKLTAEKKETDKVTTEYLVPSFNGENNFHYSVTYDSKLMRYKCSCPDYRFHCEPLDEMCKHISRIEEFSNLELENIPTTKSNFDVSVVVKTPVVKTPVVKTPVVQTPVVKTPVEKKTPVKKKQPVEKKRVDILADAKCIVSDLQEQYKKVNTENGILKADMCSLQTQNDIMKLEIECLKIELKSKSVDSDSDSESIE